MPLSLVQLVPPLVEPWTVAEMRSHLRIDTDAEDGYLGDLISAARDDVELYLRRQLLPATWVLGLDTFLPIIELPRPPLLSVLSVACMDAYGVLVPVPITDYAVDTLSTPARLWTNTTWPDVPSGYLNSIQITYQAGYASTAHIPPSIKQAIALLVGDFYEHREARLDLGNGISRIEDNPTVGRLLWKHRVLEV